MKVKYLFVVDLLVDFALLERKRGVGGGMS